MRFFQLREFDVPGVDILGKGTGTVNPNKTAPAMPPEHRKDRINFNQRTIGFSNKLRQIANALQVAEADLLKVMHFETGGSLSPSARNDKTNAVGLIQFMPDTARSLGTSTEELSKMSAEQQLEYVYRFYKKWNIAPGSSASDIYLLTFFPAAVVDNLPPNTILGRKNSNAYVANNPKYNKTEGALWAQNPIFRPVTRNYFTVADVRRIIDRT